MKFPFLLLITWVVGPGEKPGRPVPPKTEFIFEKAPFAQCHASTLAETKDGLIAAWFGGVREGHPGVGIWVSRQRGGKWLAPVEAANGVQPDGKRFPCWNPVLFQPRKGPLLLFYKVGPSPRTWWCLVRTSGDQGETWSEPRRLPAGFLGPIRNKPVELADGTLLCPSSTEDAGWRIHFERTGDLGKTWKTTGPLNDAKKYSAIQPCILIHPDGRLQALGRTRNGMIFQIWSKDRGRTWGAMTLLDLPNPNSAIDAVTLADGRHLLVYNHTAAGRTPLNLALSGNGQNWKPVQVLENQPGEYSYPCLLQTRDGLVHVTYTWKRQKIRHVVVDPKKW